MWFKRDRKESVFVVFVCIGRKKKVRKYECFRLGDKVLVCDEKKIFRLEGY